SKHECNHLPLIFKEHLVSEHPSLTNIYDAGPSKKRPSSTMDASISKHECNHLPLIFKEHLVSEHPSLTNIYDAGPSKKRPSSTMDASIVHMN
ncbi:jg6463, partial [Pararge aegeria aegeria]